MNGKMIMKAIKMNKAVNNLPDEWEMTQAQYDSKKELNYKIDKIAHYFGQ